MLDVNGRTVEAYDDALQAFLDALGLDPQHVVEIVVQPHQAVVKQASFEQAPDGTMQGTFWQDVIERGK